MKFFILILLSISCASCHFQTNFAVTAKKISFNQDKGGLHIQLLHVDSFDANGYPSQFKPESTYYACLPENLPDEAVVHLLPRNVKAEFLRYAAIKDSITRNKINDTLQVADTLVWEDGSRMYRPPGIHWSIEWNKAAHKAEQIKSRHMHNTRVRTYYFSKNTQKYTWYGGAGDWLDSKKAISGFSLIPGRWYSSSFQCDYGLLTDGRCTIYFMADEQGKITCRRIDNKNDGAF